MKFCQICGKPLQDNEVCNCQARPGQAVEDQRTVAANQTYAAPQPQPQPQPQRPAPAPQPQPYAAPQRPAYPQQPYPGQYGQAPGYPMQQPQYSEGKFVKALKTIPVVFKSYWTSSDKLIGIAKKTKDWILPLLFIAIFFLINLILGICYFARMTGSEYMKGLGMFITTFQAYNSTYQFGFTLLSALIMTVFTACLYINFRFLASLILCKKKPADAFMDALIEFGIHSMPISCWLFLGALLTLATCWLTVPFIGFAMAYYVVIGVSNTVKECGETKNVFLRDVILAAFVMLAIGLTTWMLFLCCQMHAAAKLTF